MMIATIPATITPSLIRISKLGSSESEIRACIMSVNMVQKAKITIMAFNNPDIVDKYNLYGIGSQPRLEVINRLGYPSIKSRGIANESKHKGYRGNREILWGGD